MKTLEFKLSLTRSQEQIINDWLSAQKYPWNKGVELIKRFNEFNHYDKRFKASAPCCPAASYNHSLRITNSKNRERTESLKENEYLSCPIGWQVANYSGLACSVEARELEQGLIDEDKRIEGVSKRAPFGIFPVRLFDGGKLVTNLTYFGLLPVFAHKRNTDKPWFTAVDSKFIAGTVKTLADAWQAFLDGKRKPPKYKNKQQRIDTLIHNNTLPDGRSGRVVIPVDGDRLKLPKIGWVRVKGFSKRWPAGVPFCPLKICRKASAYYLQVTGEIKGGGDGERTPPKPPKVPSVGLDPGIRFVYSDDAGKQVKVPDYLEKDLQKLKELQRKAQKQWDMNHKEGSWEKKNWRKTQDKVAKLHEKIARRGRAFNHFQSTKIVRQFEQIFLEDYRVSEIVGKVDPIDSGKLVVNVNDELASIYDQNGRKLNRATNRAALRNRVGQLWTMIETKGGKRVIRVERTGTSNECPNCGNTEDKTLKIRTHRCKVCGFVAPRDVAAAQVIKKRGLAGTGRCEKPGTKEKRQKRGGKKDLGDAIA